MTQIDPIFVDTRTACQLLGIKKTYLFQALKDGRLVRCKIGRKTVVPLESLRAFAAEIA